MGELGFADIYDRLAYCCEKMKNYAEAFRYYARAVNSAAAAMKNGEDAYGMMVSALEKITGF